MSAEQKNHFQWLQFLSLFLLVLPGWLGLLPFFSLLLLHFFLWLSMLHQLSQQLQEPAVVWLWPVQLVADVLIQL